MYKSFVTANRWDSLTKNVYIRVRHVLGDSVFCVCICIISEAPHYGLFLLDNVVDLHPSTAISTSDKAVALTALITWTFIEKGNTLHGSF